MNKKIIVYHIVLDPINSGGNLQNGFDINLGFKSKLKKVILSPLLRLTDSANIVTDIPICSTRVLFYYSQPSINLTNIFTLNCNELPVEYNIDLELNNPLVNIIIQRSLSGNSVSYNLEYSIGIYLYFEV